MVTLRSADGVDFEVDEEVALQSQRIRHAIEEFGADNAIPLPEVTSAILARVISYCENHVEAANPDLRAWDDHFVDVDRDILFELILAANYLNINGLLDLTTQAAADRIRGRTAEEIRRFFNIVGPVTPEEEEEVRRENQWAFE